ncbi:MAG: MaoC family dehydratase [Pseudomonadales bacterium]
MQAIRAVAKNYSEASENKIHSDDIARRFGFRGALVPGVAVWGQLTRPLVTEFGERWLGCSVSDVRFLKPAYDGDTLTIEPAEDASGLHVRCSNQHGELLAELNSRIPEVLPELEDQGCFDGPHKDPARIEMSWETVVPGQPFRPWHCQITDDGNQTFASQVDDPQAVYRFAAHPHWLLGLANQALVREFVMPAWIHVGSEVRLRRVVRVGDTLEIRAVPLEKWERKGHQFVRLYLAYLNGHELTTEILHTAIFRVAG